MKQLVFCITTCLLSLLLTTCKGQPSHRPAISKNKLVGGGCDGCELMYIGMPEMLNAIDTSAGWSEPGQKLLVTGKVFKIDGTTPAPNVIIYYWQTDSRGLYAPARGMNEKARRHGHIRGWVKTDKHGNYSIYTNRPAPYPDRDIPAHIHFSIKEPDIANEYYIDDAVFDDDPLLTGAKRKELPNRGGSGILRVLVSGELQVAEHKIILGQNIPDYPQSNKSTITSGLPIGEDNPSFTPYHAFGPDKGTRTCPVCKYGRFHGILYFVGNHPDWDDIKKWLLFLEQESIVRGRYLKAHFIYGNEQGYDKRKRESELENLGSELGLSHIALTFVPSLTDPESEVSLNKINPEVENTVVIFKQSNIVAKFINLKATTSNFHTISTTLDATKGAFFHLPAPRHEER